MPDDHQLAIPENLIHDLQEQTITQADRLISGSDMVKMIFRNISKDVPILVYSMNISRAPIMVKILESTGFNVTRNPFADSFRDLVMNCRTTLWHRF